MYTPNYFFIIAVFKYIAYSKHNLEYAMNVLDSSA